ncbi:TetR/AcrR family transcriptional regulator [Actinomycetes bacterium M1A6_2h]
MPPDEARLVPLLWAPRDRASRTGLSIGAITTAGIAIADRAGLAAVTMRGVADELSVGTMSLYTHVPGKPELLALMRDAVDHEVYAASVLPASFDDWQERVRHMARRNWESCLRHPWQLDISPTASSTLGPGVVGKYELELGGVDGIGLDDVQMDMAVALIQSHASSSARWYLGVHGTSGGAMTEDEWWESMRSEWQRVEPVLALAMNRDDYPLASRVGAASAQAYEGADAEALFRFGLDRIVDGLAVLIGGK